MPLRPDNFESPTAYFLCVSRWQNFKNVSMLVDAYAEAYRINPFIPDLVLVGKEVDGELSPLDRLKAQHLLSKVKIFSDLKDVELAFLYDNALINITPSLFEGFGLSVLEGLKRGCPSLDHRFTSTSEISGDAGIHIDMESKSELSNVLLYLSSKDFPIDNFRNLASQRAKFFTWSKSLKFLESYYSE
jgi:glycosyltransferase involved in cell wall biosynthesis